MGQLLVVTNGYERLPFSLNVKNRAGAVIQHAADEARWRDKSEASARQLAATEEEMVQLLKRITGEAENLFRTLSEKSTVLNPADKALVVSSIYRFRRLCYHAQTEARQLTRRPDVALPNDPYRDRLSTSEAISNRELEILELLRSGASNREIGLHLHISPHTVSFHCKNIYRKLGVSGRVEAVQAVLEWLTSSKKPTQSGS